MRRGFVFLCVILFCLMSFLYIFLFCFPFLVKCSQILALWSVIYMKTENLLEQARVEQSVVGGLFCYGSILFIFCQFLFASLLSRYCRKMRNMTPTKYSIESLTICHKKVSGTSESGKCTPSPRTWIWKIKSKEKLIS